MRGEHKGNHGYRERREHRDRDQININETLDPQHKSAQTFRRGKALAFLEKLNNNRSTLQRQLNEPELESIKQVISGELKATEAIIDEFIHVFHIHEIPSVGKNLCEHRNQGDEMINEHNQSN